MQNSHSVSWVRHFKCQYFIFSVTKTFKWKEMMTMLTHRWKSFKIYLPIWTAPGKLWLSVRTVNPFSRLVTVYSRGRSWAAIGLWPWKKEICKFSCLLQSAYFYDMYTYSKWDGWIRLDNLEGGSWFVKSIENSVEDTWVGSKVPSLLIIKS